MFFAWNFGGLTLHDDLTGQSFGLTKTFSSELGRLQIKDELPSLFPSLDKISQLE